MKYNTGKYKARGFFRIIICALILAINWYVHEIISHKYGVKIAYWFFLAINICILIYLHYSSYLFKKNDLIWALIINRFLIIFTYILSIAPVFFLLFYISVMWLGFHGVNST